MRQILTTDLSSYLLTNYALVCQGCEHYSLLQSLKRVLIFSVCLLFVCGKAKVSLLSVDPIGIKYEGIVKSNI